MRLDVPAEELVAANLHDAHHLGLVITWFISVGVLLLHARPRTRHGTLDEVTQHVRAPVRSNRIRASLRPFPRCCASRTRLTSRANITVTFGRNARLVTLALTTCAATCLGG